MQKQPEDTADHVALNFAKMREDDEIRKNPATVLSTALHPTRKSAPPNFTKQISMKFSDLGVKSDHSQSMARSSESFGHWSVSDYKPWTCVSCTYVNENALHLTCEVCGQDRPAKKAGGGLLGPTDYEFGEDEEEVDLFAQQQQKMKDFEQNQILGSRYKELMKHQNRMLAECAEADKEEESSHRADADFISDGSVQNLLQERFDSYKRHSKANRSNDPNEVLFQQSAELSEDFLRQQEEIMKSFNEGKKEG